MTEFIQGIFDRLLTDPNNKRISEIGLVICTVALSVGMMISWYKSH
jgi:hypothetical protein